MAHVVPLGHPTSTERIERRRGSPLEERGMASDLNETKHLVFSEEAEEITHRGYMNVVDDQECAPFEMRVDVVVLKVRVRIGVWTVEKGELERMVEGMRRERNL